MEVRGFRLLVPRPTVELLALALALLLGGCTKSKVDYWGQPAGPKEQLTPGFPETAARLYSALEQERQKLAVSEAEFDQFEPTVKQLREETQKTVRSRVDRDLDFLLEGYAGKLKMLRIYHRLRNGNEYDEYLPALHEQLDQCNEELERLFTVHPMPRPSAMGTNSLSPCIGPVPRTK